MAPGTHANPLHGLTKSNSVPFAVRNLPCRTAVQVAPPSAVVAKMPPWHPTPAGTGSGCGAHRAPPSRVTSSTSGDVALHALASQSACA
jgi:hypothetical protein